MIDRPSLGMILAKLPPGMATPLMNRIEYLKGLHHRWTVELEQKMRTSYDDEYVRHWRESLADLQQLIGELEKIATWEASCDAHV